MRLKINCQTNVRDFVEPEEAQTLPLQLEQKETDAMRTSILILTCALAAGATAQEAAVNDSVQLKEVAVTASRVIDRTDGRSYVPDEAQRKNAASGWALLGKMALPGIRIDVTQQTATAADNTGAVQVRLNGIVATKADLQTLDPKTIVRVDFIDRPGVRYGDDIAYVIDVRTRRATGYTVGTHLDNALTTWYGANDVFGSWNKGKSQLSLYYQNSYNDLRGSRTTEQARYLMADGTTRDVLRRETASRSRTFGNSAELKYNLAGSLYVFQASLSQQTSNVPGDYSRGEWTDVEPLAYANAEHSHSVIPTLDLYFFRQLSAQQSLTASASGTYISTAGRYSQDEGTPYIYGVDGSTRSLLGEVVYENRLKPFTLSAGVNVNWKYSHNRYTGDSEADNHLHKSGIYGFTQIGGRLGKFRYTLGLGASNQSYSQGTYDYSHWLFRPKASLQYKPAKGLTLSYGFEYTQQVSAYAMTSDAAIRQNSLEWKVGNPAITPSSRETHRAGITYNRPRFYTSLSYEYRWCRRCNMDRYERTADGRFLNSQTNQHGVGMWYVTDYTRLELLSQSRLVLSFQGGYYRFFSSGDAYSNHRHALNGSVDLQSELGRWSLAVSADNGWNFLEGTHGGKNVLSVAASASYRFGNCSVGLIAVNPFMAHPRISDYFITHPLVSKSIVTHGADSGNHVRLTFSWRLSGGKKYRDIERRQSRKDTDAGILK